MWDTARELNTNSWAMFSYGPLHIDVQMLADHQELIYNSFVQVQYIIWKTCLKQWILETYGERESGKSVLAVRLMMTLKTLLHAGCLKKFDIILDIEGVYEKKYFVI